MRHSRMLVAGLIALAAPASAAQAAALTGTLAVVNKADGTVSLVDLASRAITATVPVGEGPHEVAVSPDGRWAVVSNYGPTRAPGQTLSLIDIAQGTVDRTISLGRHRRPHGLAWLPDGSKLLVTVESDSALLLIDVASGAVSRVFHVGQDGPNLLSLTADGARAYVTNLAASTLTAVDLSTGTTVTSASLPWNADGVAFRPGGDELWVASPGANQITVVAASDLAIRGTIRSEDYPIRVRFTPDGARALVIFAKSSQLKLFDAASRKESDVILMRISKAAMHGSKGAEGYENHTVPIGLAMSRDGRWAFVTYGGVDAVTVVSLADKAIAWVLFVGREPDGVAYSPVVRKATE